MTSNFEQCMQQLTELCGESTGIPETMKEIKQNLEKLAKAAGAVRTEFTMMQDGVDYGFYVDFGDGNLEPFYNQ